jgi:hypothetical protein
MITVKLAIHRTRGMINLTPAQAGTTPKADTIATTAIVEEDPAVTMKA